MTETILIVEDADKIVGLLRLYLEREGYAVHACADGRAALDAFAARTPRLVILDLMLPEVDCVEVCRRLRAESPVPILMLTARVDEVDKLLGLSLGADDYVTKPFSPREVVARVKAILRRTGREAPAPNQRRVHDLEIDGRRAPPRHRRRAGSAPDTARVPLAAGTAGVADPSVHS